MSERRGTPTRAIAVGLVPAAASGANIAASQPCVPARGRFEGGFTHIPPS
jgi:hypothetical protein